jgi:hypothetical protein
LVVADVADHLGEPAQRRPHLVRRRAELLLHVPKRRFHFLQKRAQDDPRPLLEQAEALFGRRFRILPADGGCGERQDGKGAGGSDAVHGATIAAGARE